MISRQKTGKRLIWRMALVILLALRATVAAEDQTANEPAVKLPPMIVQESLKGPRWQYASTTTGEYLSACSAGTTRDFIAAEQGMRQLLHVLVPEKFLVQSDVPAITVLYNSELKQKSSDEVVSALAQASQEAERAEPDHERRARAARIGRVEVLPNLRLEDRDLKALFVYLDEGAFNSDRLVLVPEYVRAMLRERTPMLPAWLIEGIVDLYGHATFVDDPISLQPAIWVSRRDTHALERDAEWPRTMLPITDLFGIDPPTDDTEHPRRAAIWRSQVALFARWGLDPRTGMRDNFWLFAERASEAPPSNQMFTECFGFGFSDLLDRLSDYIPLAVKEPIRIEPGKLPKLPKVEVRPATPDQVARLQGEWGRMEIAYVKARQPQFARDYADRARQMLRRAYQSGTRDPRLSAAIGLCELDSGNEAAGRPFLDQAAANDVVRPRVYYELARIRWTELPRDNASKTPFSALQITAIVEPLRVATKQRPALPEVYALFADAWLRCSDPAPPEDLATLSRGAKLFRWRPELAFRIALLQAKCGQRAEAAALLDDALHYVYDDATRSRFEQLLAGVKGKSAVSK
jgi:hypothetical protein